MTYGNKTIFLVLLLSFLFIIGCENKLDNFYFDLYDGYNIQSIAGKIRLYHDDNIIKIEGENYQIKEVKYNSDVVCLKLANNRYYMVYYVDSSVYGPYTKDNLEKTIQDDSTMIFTNDFKDIKKIEGLIYE